MESKADPKLDEEEIPAPPAPPFGVPLSPAHSRPSSPSHFPKLSLSTTSLSSLLPSFYSRSTPNLAIPRVNSAMSKNASPPVSDLLARESDVIVSTNITSQAEYKGFASYVISGIFLTIWLIWSLCPDNYLVAYGIHYYPSRWWAIAVPSFILVSMGYVYVALAAYNIEIKTLKLDDLRTIVDDSGVVVTQLDAFGKETESDFFFNSTSGIWDLGISDVNRVLYSEK